MMNKRMSRLYQYLEEVEINGSAHKPASTLDDNLQLLELTRG